MARVTRFCGVPILAASVLLITITGFAQVQRPTRAPRAQSTNQATMAGKGNLTPVPGQRRGLTDAMRRAAAARNAARKAAAGQTNQVGLRVQQGVKK